MEIDDIDYNWLMDKVERYIKWNPVNRIIEDYFEMIKRKYEVKCSTKDINNPTQKLRKLLERVRIL